eukprot:scaffold102736_cov33-Prasinocladus_malaysianus.AAC.1
MPTQDKLTAPPACLSSSRATCTTANLPLDINMPPQDAPCVGGRTPPLSLNSSDEIVTITLVASLDARTQNVQLSEEVESLGDLHDRIVALDLSLCDWAAPMNAILQDVSEELKSARGSTQDYQESKPDTNKYTP